MRSALDESAPALTALGAQMEKEASLLAPLREKQAEIDAVALRQTAEGAAAQARVDSLGNELRQVS